MVSNARLDLPDPDRPVTTTSLSRGISTEMPLRLCTRAPCTATVVRAAGLRLELIARLGEVDERELFDARRALLREARRHRRLADQPLVGEVLARGGHSADAEVSREVILDLPARPRLADVAEMLDDRREQLRRACGHVCIDGREGGLDGSPRLLGVEQI